MHDLKLHEKLAKRGHMALAKVARDLYETCKEQNGIIANAIKEQEHKEAEIEALREEIARLREVRYKIYQILHSAKAANEILAG